MTFWDSAETSKEIIKTCLLTMLLSKWTIHELIDSKLHVIVRKINR